MGSGANRAVDAMAGAWWLLSPAVANSVPALRERAGRRTLRRQGSISGPGASRAMRREPDGDQRRRIFNRPYYFDITLQIHDFM